MVVKHKKPEPYHPAQKFEIPDEARDRFAQLFAQVREQRAIPQWKVGKDTGLSQTFVSTLELGASGDWSLVNTLRLAKYYGISPQQVADVLGLAETPEEKEASLIPEYLKETVELLKEIPQERIPAVNAALTYFRHKDLPF